jgi:hypothetical protein
LKKKTVLGIILTLLLIGIFCITSNVKLVTAWSNGGYSADPSNPNYGTHDWIAEHALDWLPTEEKQYILDNRAAYLYGTELPDRSDIIRRHYVYYWSNGSLQDDASAVRAYEEYNKTLNFLKSGDLVNASKNAGIMSHYIVDLAVFGHVMGAGTDWGPEIHHDDYETYVNERTNSYNDEFNSYLSFDGELRNISAYDAAIELAYDTTFDVDGNLTCVWMDQNYNWSDPLFKDRCGESLNLAVNYLTDVLHTLSQVVPIVSIVSPENKTYTVGDIPLTFTVSGSTLWMGYSLDGQANVTISSNTTLVDLSEGNHTITVYANNTAGNIGSSKMVYFTIIPEIAESFPILIVAAILMMGGIEATLLVYLTRRKKYRRNG